VHVPQFVQEQFGLERSTRREEDRTAERDPGDGGSAEAPAADSQGQSAATPPRAGQLGPTIQQGSRQCHRPSDERARQRASEFG